MEGSQSLVKTQRFCSFRDTPVEFDVLWGPCHSVGGFPNQSGRSRTQVVWLQSPRMGSMMILQRRRCRVRGRIGNPQDWKSSATKNRRFRLPGAIAKRRGFEPLDGVNLVEEFDERACLMKTVPRFLKGPYRIALRTVLEEINVEDLGQQERWWKLFLLLPRFLLHRGPTERRDHRQAEVVGFEKFNSGAWLDLLEESRKVTQEAAQARRRRNRRTEDDLTRRVSRADASVHMGEVSSARQVLEGASLAPTLNAFRDPAKRPPEPRTPLPIESCRPHHVQLGSVDVLP